MPGEKPKITIGQIREKLEPRFERFYLKDVATIMMREAKPEFSQEIQGIIDKGERGERLHQDEREKLNNARNDFWEKKFGGSFDEMYGTKQDIGYKSPLKKKPPTETVNKIGKKAEGKVKLIERQKVEKMQALHQAIKNLDNGEIVQEFADESRRAVYFDEKSSKYFILENGKPRYLEVADLLSDYAWGIKYVPDAEMIEPSYRRLAKKVLVNETRRDLEEIHNKELVLQNMGAGHSEKFEIVEKNWVERRDINTGSLGFITESMARELLARVAADKRLDFVVERADAVEDGIYKYDFKVRSLVKLRGVGIGGEVEINSRIKKIGLQFTIKKSVVHKIKDVKNIKQLMLETKLPVDDVVLCKVRTTEFGEAFDKWLAEGKPSGGPEQFLSPEIKAKLLEAVQDRLFEKGETGAIYIH